MSTQRRHEIESGSMPSSLPCSRLASSRAARRLLAAPIAWMSPVKWRFRSSIGTTWARSEEHTSELQSHSDLVCRLLLEKKKTEKDSTTDPSQHKQQRNPPA